MVKLKPLWDWPYEKFIYYPVRPLDAAIVLHYPIPVCLCGHPMPACAEVRIVYLGGDLVR